MRHVVDSMESARHTLSAFLKENGKAEELPTIKYVSFGGPRMRSGLEDPCWIFKTPRQYDVYTDGSVVGN